MTGGGIQLPASKHNRRKEEFDVSKMYKPSLTLKQVSEVRNQKSEAQRQTAGTFSL
jgi:hypothetical protein